MASPNTDFQKLAKTVSSSPPPLWPEFPLPDDVAKRFPSMVEAVKIYTESCKEFFKQQSISK